ncbi:MBOAT family O-acyltransferase [Pseudoalteromonas spongiae]|uniref:MBOAT family O-acyltransferase n=1 Tax=Pseudoalteromonas spongiae TaxID=298657 RepID=UPI00110B5F2D|nr:MBOAT family protein [Pseudoalteromonas spongiae]TMO83645.1 membrane-bound O-acyltransferase family protein [Pseudoalteromonas spongiae]
MLFSSPVFLFLFLPLLLASYFLINPKFRNILLLVASLIFYAWGEVYYVFLMLFSILMNYIIGLCISESKSKKLFLIFGVCANLTILIGFKYANFIVDNLNTLLSFTSLNQIDLAQIPLPIGISFFTFQAMSYLIDLYRKEVPVQKNIFDLALYIALFPQLIAGPIVRYHDVAAQIKKRVIDVPLFYSGIQRFVFGLSKKMLIANPLGSVADSIFALPNDEISMGLAWLGIICYTLQIYFDFSGYSDMAIGLGRMFGFKFLENFNFPYISQSIQEFWRRWHISLSSWYRDYLYIPLGGNRKGEFRTYLNLLIVFTLCGLWHGASWNFLIWGIYHGAFLMFERLGLLNIVGKTPKLFRHCYVLIVVMIGWVFFRAETVDTSFTFISAMFGGSDLDTTWTMLSEYVNYYILSCLVLGGILSTPMYGYIKRQCENLSNEEVVTSTKVATVGVINTLLLISLLALSFIMIAANSYNPFIYFRF